MQAFRDLVLDRETRPFMIGAELVTTRGRLEQPEGRKLASLGDALAADERIDWVSITDNAGGNPMLTPAVLGRRLRERGQEVIIHLTCKDRNRNGLESAAWQYASEGLDNILCLTGDYPIDGYLGFGLPVFDLDSVTLTWMLGEMNAGLVVPGRKPGSRLKLDATSFFKGVAVSPFKNNEAELISQYRKLEMKAYYGADFVIPQLGYDMRKSHELLLYMRRQGLDLPVFGNIYLLNKTVANLFNKQKIPGCVVSDALLAEIKRRAGDQDKGKAFFSELAAKQYACFRGLGYRGAYFGGFHKMEQLEQVLEIAAGFGPDDWREFARDLVWPSDPDYYLYAQDEATGLADDAAPSPEAEAAKGQVDEQEIGLWYRTNRAFHKVVFEPDGPLFKPMRALYRKSEEKLPLVKKALEWEEKVVKKALFDCQDCGDCSLPDIHYMCPGSKCKKNQRNGPCGGSRMPLCEVAEINCIWYRAYHRAKKFGEMATFLRRPAILRNHQLQGTSGWANYFTGRDHAHAMPSKERPTPQSALGPVAGAPTKVPEATAHSPAEAAAFSATVFGRTAVLSPDMVAELRAEAEAKAREAGDAPGPKPPPKTPGEPVGATAKGAQDDKTT